MGERITNGGEMKYSPEQQRLIDSAHDLLVLPDAVTSGLYEYGSRWVSKNHRLVDFLGKFARKPDSVLSAILDTDEPAYIETTKSISLRGATSKDNNGEPLYAWNSSVSLIQTIKQDIRTKQKQESLIMRAQAAINNPDAYTESMVIIDKTLWENDLLTPIDDPDEVRRLQQEIDAAVNRYT